MLSPTTTLQIVSFLDMLTIGLLMPQLGNQAIKLGASQILLGTMGALYSGLQMVSEPMIGSLSDVKGRKPILMLILIFCGFAYLIQGLTTSLVLFFVIRGFLGLTKQTFLLINALAPDYEMDPDRQAELFGKLATLSGLSIAIGPVLGGHIMELFPDTGFAIISAILWIIYSINAGLIRGLPDINATKDKKSNEITDGVSPKLFQSVTNSLKQSIDQFYQVDWSVYWDAFIFKLILSFCMAIYFSNFAIFLTTKHNATPIYIGYIISFQGIISAICTYFIGFINKLYVKDKDYSQRVSHIFLILTVSQLGMAVAPSIYIYILFVIPFAVAGAISRIVELEMIVSKGDSERRGSVIGALGTLRSLAGVVTPLVAGFIAQYLGVTYTVLTAAFLTSIGVVHSYNSQNVPVRPKKD